ENGLEVGNFDARGGQMVLDQRTCIWKRLSQFLPIDDELGPQSGSKIAYIRENKTCSNAFHSKIPLIFRDHVVLYNGSKNFFIRSGHLYLATIGGEDDTCFNQDDDYEDEREGVVEFIPLETTLLKVSSSIADSGDNGGKSGSNRGEIDVCPLKLGLLVEIIDFGMDIQACSCLECLWSRCNVLMTRVLLQRLPKVLRMRGDCHIQLEKLRFLISFVEFAIVEDSKAALAGWMTLGSRYIELFMSSPEEMRDPVLRG
ncbi:hypothetical protein M8C21_012176, partial [Ambrosia artemisiifolia]